MARSPIYNFSMTMDGTFQKIEFEKNWYNVVIQMRTAVDLKVSYNGVEYFTVKSGAPIEFSSRNFSIEDTDEIYVNAASGTLEIMTFIRY